MKWERSAQFYKRARTVMPSGVSSAFRARQKPVPLFIDHGCGARLYDVDGNEYFDYALGHGPLILGHCHPAIVGAVEKQLARGSTFGCQHELEAEVAEKMLRVLPWAERVLFSNTGTEAVQIALRLARAVTGRRLVVKFEGDYHGTVYPDEAFTRPHAMRALVRHSFTHSLTCFAWRNTKAELEKYPGEITRPPVSGFLRPELWLNPLNILHKTLQVGRRAAARGSARVHFPREPHAVTTGRVYRTRLPGE